MIIGLLFRNFKCYSGINYIPVSIGHHFSAYIGENGAGKSSILEALDVFFNGGQWNVNNDALVGGLSTRKPFICPIFLLEKDKWTSFARTTKEKESLHLVENISKVLWNATTDSFNAAQREDAAKFIQHRDLLKAKIDHNQYFLCAFGQEYETTEKRYISIFGSIAELQNVIATNYKQNTPTKDYLISEATAAISKFVLPHYTYIYTPAEVDVEKYTKIESRAVQKLSGKNIETILRNVISDTTLKDINKKLATFIADIQETLGDYEYKRPQKRQSNLTFSDLSSKVIETYFNIRVLNKSHGKTRTPVSQLSSGEKKKALVDIAFAFLKNNGDLGREVIFAMDEPEASLHTGAIFEQFEKVAALADLNIQCLVTTHWYGFVPTLAKGAAINILKTAQSIETSLIDLSFYRETVRRQKEISKGLLPADIGLKSTNDLIQTIMSSLRKRDPYSWLICEGTSERIYFEQYFKTEILSRKLKILPVGGAKEVKKIFDYLELPIKEDSKEIYGKVFCLIDTDEQQIECDCPDYKNLKLRRLLDLNGNITLVKGNDNRKTPPTEIEDALDAEIFLKTLAALAVNDPEVDELFNKIHKPDFSKCARSAFDWRSSEYIQLKNIFNQEHMKSIFAHTYIQELTTEENTLPAWIEEIRRELT
ncbi:hypothetical protein PPUJ13061_17130 [Pseudomonas putida]|uniref:AAA family ATPase n=1 Tax=Pseudomonas putida TaxID=303 RepID=UPI000E0DDB54|nr:AAA family ATPase [Pseudomonas putida]WQE52986.1 AAA family ATPase [Pseudomonas putida]GLO01815.1 hypothetical protein PPUJ13061_17130 [Pseudomonas putida]HDS1006241.1 AAA family ATPase [Pseudomonas putida]